MSRPIRNSKYTRTFVFHRLSWPLRTYKSPFHIAVLRHVKLALFSQFISSEHRQHPKLIQQGCAIRTLRMHPEKIYTCSIERTYRFLSLLRSSRNIVGKQNSRFAFLFFEFAFLYFFFDRTHDISWDRTTAHGCAMWEKGRENPKKKKSQLRYRNTQWKTTKLATLRCNHLIIRTRRIETATP